MAKKQGFQFFNDPFVYQEIESGVSTAIGIDDSDSDKIKIVTSATPGANPSGTNQNLVIDPSTNGNITISPNGTGVITSAKNISLTSSAGVTFDGGTNVLNFYETGSFLPVLRIGGSTSGISYGAVRIGRYTRIGNMVMYSYIFVISAKGGGTGDVTVDLPFTSSNVARGVSILRYENFATDAVWFAYVSGGDNMRFQTAGSAATTLIQSDINNTSSFSASVMYQG